MVVQSHRRLVAIAPSVDRPTPTAISAPRIQGCVDDARDRLIIDLDPGEGVTFRDLRQAAFDVRTCFERLGLNPFLQLAGGKGLHVLAPLKPRANWTQLKQTARAIALEVERASPTRFVATANKARRRGRIFIDYLRNDWFSTAIACWSPRARPGAYVSVPFSWEKLAKARSLPRCTITDVLAGRVDERAWDGFDRAAIALKRV